MVAVTTSLLIPHGYLLLLYFSWSHSSRTSCSGQPSQPAPSVLGSELEKSARNSFKWEGESRDDLGGVEKTVYFTVYMESAKLPATSGESDL